MCEECWVCVLNRNQRSRGTGEVQAQRFDAVLMGMSLLTGFLENDES